MSKIDDQLAHSIYCGVWEAHHNDDGELQSGPCSCDLQEARAELAALRQRAEDAVKVIAAERSEIWINFHTPTAQAAADEMLKRIESAILKDATGS